MTWLTDPRLFNYVLLVLYLCNAIRWLLHGSWGDFFYWTGAFRITASITFGFHR